MVDDGEGALVEKEALHAPSEVSAVVGSLGGDHDARREMDKSEEVPMPMMYRR